MAVCLISSLSALAVAAVLMYALFNRPAWRWDDYSYKPIKMLLETMKNDPKSSDWAVTVMWSVDTNKGPVATIPNDPGVSYVWLNTENIVTGFYTGRTVSTHRHAGIIREFKNIGKEYGGGEPV